MDNGIVALNYNYFSIQLFKFWVVESIWVPETGGGSGHGNNFSVN